MASRLLRFFVALVRYRDIHYARRLLGRASANLRLVLGSLGSHYVRIRPWQDLGGASEGAACERLEAGSQPEGFVRINLIAYHMVLSDVDGRVVIDAGTNEGYGAALFASRAREVIAFDRSPDAIDRARERYHSPNLRFAVHDAEKPFPVEDGSADVVFSSEVIEHLAQPAAFVEAAHRALRPGGVLLVKTPNVAFNRYENRLNEHHLHPFDAEALRRTLSRGFNDVTVQGLTFDTEVVSRIEDRPDDESPETRPYRFGDSIVVDRVMVSALRVTPRRTRSTGGADAEYLFARAVRDGGA